MSTAQTLLLGAIAGCTIFIGLPVARLRNVPPSVRSMLAAVATGILAFLFWVEENPGTFPRVETWWARTRGRIARTIAPLRPQRRPKA